MYKKLPPLQKYKCLGCNDEYHTTNEMTGARHLSCKSSPHGKFVKMRGTVK